MLAISTATKKAMIAIKAKDVEVFSSLDADCRQSEAMMQEIHNLLTKNNLTLADVGNFGLVTGPGSFTGLRIGAALVKGFCAGLKGRKVAIMPTLELMAKQVIKEASPKTNFTCYMNAQSGLYYSATFNKAGEKIVDEHLVPTMDILKGKEEKFCLAEENFLSFGITITPQTLIEFALQQEENKNMVEGKDVSVKYIRLSAAEEKI